MTRDAGREVLGILRLRSVAKLPSLRANEPLLIAVMLSGVPSRAKVGRNAVEASRRLEMRVRPAFHGILRLRFGRKAPFAPLRMTAIWNFLNRLLGHRCLPQMEAQKVGTVSGFKFEVSGSLPETRNLEPETRDVSDFLRSHLPHNLVRSKWSLCVPLTSSLRLCVKNVPALFQLPRPGSATQLPPQRAVVVHEPDGVGGFGDFAERVARVARLAEQGE